MFSFLHSAFVKPPVKALVANLVCVTCLTAAPSSAAEVEIRGNVQSIANTISGTFHPFEFAVGGRAIHQLPSGIHAIRIDEKTFSNQTSFFEKTRSDRLTVEIQETADGSFSKLFELNLPKLNSVRAQQESDGRVRIEIDTQFTVSAQSEGVPFQFSTQSSSGSGASSQEAPAGGLRTLVLYKPDPKSLEEGILVELLGERGVTRNYQMDFVVSEKATAPADPSGQTSTSGPGATQASSSPREANESPPDRRTALEKIHSVGAPGIYGAIHLVPSLSDRLFMVGIRMVGKHRWNADIHFLFAATTEHTSFGFGASGFFRVIQFNSKKRTPISVDLGWFFRGIRQTLNNSITTSNWQSAFNSGPSIQIDPLRLGPVWLGLRVDAPLIRVNNPVGIFGFPVNFGAQISIVI